MCGLAGVVDLNGLRAADWQPRLERALDRLHRRGPDASGTWRAGRAAFAHTRLKIVDLSDAGAQPMTAGDLTLAYNGELYDHDRLRDELAACGARFVGRSDTEVLLRGWQHWGPDLLRRAHGMFAFAIWDEAAGRLILARDALGKKPLLYRHDGARLTFASDLSALTALDGTAGAVDPAALRAYFTLRFVPEPLSIIDGVRKVPPGALAIFDADGLRIEPWDRSAPVDGDGAGDLTARLRAAVDAAVVERCRADVPVGVFLSGGVDSAIIAATMARTVGTPRTFTVGFDGAADYFEERPPARALAEHIGAEHHEIAIGPDRAREAFDAAFAAFDEPFGDGSSVPTWLLAQATRGDTTVALSGDGGDELFAGYRKYRAQMFVDLYQRLPRLLRDGLIEPLAAHLPASRDHPVLEFVRRAKRFAAHAGGDAVTRQAGWLRLADDDELDRLFAIDLPPYPLRREIAALRAAAGIDDEINAMLYADLRFGLPGDMLVKIDRASMAHALEVRCPLLDRRVVAAAMAAPGSAKLDRRGGKRILAKAFADRVPAEVFARPKKGFEPPLADWLAGPLRDRLRAAIDPARLARQGLLRPEVPARWLDDLGGHRRDTAWALWALLAFQAWWDRHFEGA